MTLREAFTKTRLLSKPLVPSGETVVPEGVHLMEGTYEVQFVENCGLWKGLSSWRTVSCGSDHTLEQVMSVRGERVMS